MKKGTKRATPKPKVFLIDFTREQKQLITAHCKRRKQKVGDFLTKVALKDVAQASKARTQKITVTLTFPLSYEERQKLQLFADIEQTEPQEFISKLLNDALYQALHRHQISNPKRESHLTRFELPEQDFEVITRHLTALNVSARKYLPLLAMQAIKKTGGKKRA